MLVLLAAVVTGAWAQTYNVTKDATMSDGWTIDPTNATAGETVTATYSGTRHVKSVKYLGVPTLTAAPTPIDGITYNGLEQALVNAGTATNGTLQYKVNDGEYAADIPTATDAGTYTVYYKVVGAAGFVDLDEASVEVEIAAAPVSYTAPTLVSSTLTYNGSGRALVTGGSATGGTIYYRYDYTPYIGSASSSEWSTTVPAPTNAGTYTVYYKVEPNAGYSGGVESTLLGDKIISKANGWVTLSPSSSSGWKNVIATKSATATISHHGGSLTATSSNSNKVTAYIDGNTLTVIKQLQMSGSGCFVTVYSAATNNYNQATARYDCND